MVGTTKRQQRMRAAAPLGIDGNNGIYGIELRAWCDNVSGACTAMHLMNNAIHRGVLLLAAMIAASAASAQNPRSSLRAVTASTAPERVVYEVFTAEVIANDRSSADPTLTPDRRRQIAGRLQAVTGLSDGDYSVLKGISERLHFALESNARAGDASLNDPRLSTAQRGGAIAALRKERNEAIDRAIDEWRTHLGAPFRWIDDRIRAHVARGLRITDDSSIYSSQAEGGRSR